MHLPCFRSSIFQKNSAVLIVVAEDDAVKCAVEDDVRSWRVLRRWVELHPRWRG